VEELVRLSCDVVGWRAPVEVQPGRVRPNQSEVQGLLSDNANAKRLLSWEPSVSLEQGLAKTTDWIREHLDRYKVDQYMV
jgi:nucleoside-diphosphate-sugar epimerase